MSQETGIQWTDRSSNPLRYLDADGDNVWACVKKSPGCKNCYAETLALRYGKGKEFTPSNMKGLRPYMRDKELKGLLSAKKTPPGSKVFVGDMTDVFGEWVPFELIDKLFGVMAIRHDVTFQILTKRPDRMAEYLNSEGEPGLMPDRLLAELHKTWQVEVMGQEWPLLNVWLGTSVEDQKTADERIPHLLRVPAKVRFLSMEPLLGPVSLDRELGACTPENPSPLRSSWLREIQWVIVGGESGSGSRPMELDWVRGIRRQCGAAGVPCFVKQMGAAPHDWTKGDPPNHEPPQLLPLKLRDKKGGDIEEFPRDLRVREFPEVKA